MNAAIDGRFAPMHAARWLLGAVVVLAISLTTSACGTTEQADTDAAAAVAVSQGFLNSSSPHYDLTTTQAGCLGTGVINDFGIAQAVTYKFLAEGNKPVANIAVDLPEAAAEKFAATFSTCTQAVELAKDNLINQINPSTAARAKKLKECLDENLTEAKMQLAIAHAFSRTSDSTLNSVYAACHTFG